MKKTYTDDDLLDIVKEEAKKLGRAPKGYEIPNYARKAIYRRFGSYKKALARIGLKPSGRKAKYKDQDLLNLIRNKAAELGRAPYRHEVVKGHSIANHFGGWLKAIELANLKLSTNKQALKAMKNLILNWEKKFGRAPRAIDFDNDPSLPHSYMLKKQFKMAWPDIIKSLGLKRARINKKYAHFSNNELLILFKEEYVKIKASSYKDYETRKTISLSAANLLKRFKTTWNGLLEMIEVGNDELKIHSYSRDEIILILQDVAEKVGKTPSCAEVGKHYKLNRNTVGRHFGSWNQAIKEAGLSLSYTIPADVHESNEELIQMYRSFSESIGKTTYGATLRDIDNSDEIYSSSVFTVRFGGLNNLKILAGFFIKHHVKQKFSKESITNLLLKEFRRLNRKPTLKELKSNPHLPSVSTILRHFKTTSLKAAWKEILSADNDAK